MQHQGRLSPQQLDALSDELVRLTRQQRDTRLTEIFIRMTDQEITSFELRAARISEIHAIFAEHDALR